MRIIAVLLVLTTLSVPCYCQKQQKTFPPSAPAQTANPAPTSQPQPPVITDETVRIARAEMERDAYKHAVESSEKMVDNTKWVFDRMLAAFGVIIALAGVLAYKETQKYKKAVEKAEQSAADAKKWEEQAKITLDNVDTQVNVELEKIKAEGEKQIKDLIEKAEAEQKISELWNDAARLHKDKQYGPASDKWRQITNLKQDLYGAYVNWCNTLATWAEEENSESLFKAAHNVYERLKALGEIHNDEIVIFYCQTAAGLQLAMAYSKANKIDDAISIYNEIKAVSGKHKGASEMREDQIRAGINVIAAFIRARKMIEAKTLLNEIEPLVQELKGEEERKMLANLISNMRQMQGMK